jgi:hypothetical protein
LRSCINFMLYTMLLLTANVEPCSANQAFIYIVG